MHQRLTAPPSMAHRRCSSWQPRSRATPVGGVAAAPAAARRHDVARTPRQRGGGGGAVAARAFETTGLARQILARPGLEGDPLAFLKTTEAYWKALRLQEHAPHKPGGPAVVTRRAGESLALASAASSSSSTPEYDAVVCGGTLGLFVATALQLGGWRVAVVERRLAQGRSQEWNISRRELHALAERDGLLSAAELEAAVVTECGPARVAFHGGGKDGGGEDGGSALWARGVLDVGVDPRALLASLRARFEAAGGVVLERTAFRSAEVFDDGVRVALGKGDAAPPDVGDVNRPTALVNGGGGAGAHPSNGKSASAAASAPPPSLLRELTCRVLLDGMGHYSPIVKQLRGRAKPDGVCLVVGSCASGVPAASNVSSDLLVTNSHAAGDLQLFWEAFPAAGGAARTTYMFAYSDARPERPTFEALLDAYFTALPAYTNVPSLDALDFRRVLFGAFPCYAAGALAPGWDRVLQVGDAAALQSPLSFGGFGSMVRHVGRVARALDHALRDDRLRRADLGLVNPYQPATSAAWLFQRSMSVGVGELRAPAAMATATAQTRDEPAPAAARYNGAAAVVAAAAAVSSADEAAATATSTTTTTPKAAAATTTPKPWLQLPPDHVNALLACNFGVLRALGVRALQPFLRDTLRALPLALCMLGMMLAKPFVVARVLLHVGLVTVAAWFGHFAALTAYTALHALLAPLRGARMLRGYAAQRWLDAFEFGSGGDFEFVPEEVAVADAEAAAAAKQQHASAGGAAPEADGAGRWGGEWRPLRDGAARGSQAAPAFSG